MLHTVKKAEYVEGYKLKLQFNDKTVKEVDLSDMIKRAKGMLLRLKDVDYFKKVKCDGISIVWPNGVDLCPDALYEMGKTITRPKSKKVPQIRKSRLIKKGISKR